MTLPTNNVFLVALHFGQLERARGFLSGVDWNSIGFANSPVMRVFNPTLWEPHDDLSFVLANRNRVAESAFGHYDFTGFEVQSFGGWEFEHLTDGGTLWERKVKVETLPGNDKLYWGDTQTSLTMTLDFGPRDSRLRSVDVRDETGDAVGRFPEPLDFHVQNAVHTRAAEMPQVILEVMAWCVDAGRLDLLACRAAAVPGRPGVTGPTQTVLYHCAKHRLVEAMGLALDHGAAPHDTYPSTGMAYSTLLDVIEQDHGSGMGIAIRAHLARNAAIGAIRDISPRSEGPLHG